MRLEPPPLPTTGLVTIARAGELLDCSRRTIYRLHQEGRLEVVKLGSKHVRVTLDSLHRLLQEIIDNPVQTKSE